MDQLFWKGKWEAVPEEEYLKSHEELIKKEDWIIEGYIEPRMANRLKLADKIIYLDFSGLRCVWRLIKRHFMHRKESRPELPKEAVEGALEGTYLWTVLTRKERPEIESSLKGIPLDKIKRLKTPSELKAFMNSRELNRF